MSGPVVLGLRLLMALALYAFLGAALWIIWQDIRRAQDEAATRRVPPIRLEIRAHTGKPVARAFSQSEVVIGRDPRSDVAIADRAVSARHALLSFHHGQWWIDDLGSHNGTRLNHERLSIATVLASGDEIKCGQARIVVKLDDHWVDAAKSRGKAQDV